MARDDRFHPLFESCARGIRARLALRHALTGAALGLAVATLPAAIAWKTRHGALRPYAPLVGVFGAAAGLALASRKRWSDTEVALFLDDRLETDETITTAVELRNEAETEDPTRAVVVSTAANALADARARRARPAVWKPVQLVAPVAVAGLVFLARAPLPPAPAVPPPPPGTAKVQLANVEGLEKVAKLGEMSARDDAQKERLEKIAKDAEKLKADLAKGMEKREAQDRIAHLRDEIATERLSLGEGQERAGMEAAQSKLEESDLTKDAAKDLGDHDLESFDKEMERLANQREKRDRDLAKQKLQEAADAARANGAPEVGKALDQEKESLEKREQRAEMLRDLEKGLEGAGEASPDLREQSESLDRKGTDDAAKKLADAMGKALEGLTPEERKRLADKLREQASQGGMSQGDAQSLKDLADELSTPEGQKKLEEELKDLAKQDDESDESKRQRGLDDAENGADDTQKGLGQPGGSDPHQGQGQEPGQGQAPGQGQEPGQGPGDDGQGQGQGEGQGQGQGQGQGPVPIPLPGQGQGPGHGQGGNANGDGTGGGGSHDFGTGDHKGQTGPIDADTLKSRAHATPGKGAPMPGSNAGFAPGRAGGTANVRGTGALQTVGPEEIQGVDSNDVPREYREQVRQYFQP